MLTNAIAFSGFSTDDLGAIIALITAGMDR